MKTTTTGMKVLSRREALKTMGTGAALLGLGMVSTEALAGGPPAPAPVTAPVAGSLKQPFTLPKLGYGYGDLEPYIDARTMELHYTKHHQAYVNNANKALADYPDLQKLTAADILQNLGKMPEKIRTTLRNNVGGHANHSLFWQVIGPKNRSEPDGALALGLAKAFGSYDKFQAEFNDAALKRFGSGWAWLSVKGGKLLVHSTANQDSPLSEGLTPLLGLDVWEHAYYLHYQNRRADYIAAFWNVVHWEQVAANYAAMVAG